MLRFHPHPSQRRSIGQTIGLTAYPPQRIETVDNCDRHEVEHLEMILLGRNSYSVTTHEINFETHPSLDGRTSKKISMSSRWKAP